MGTHIEASADVPPAAVAGAGSTIGHCSSTGLTSRATATSSGPASC